MDEAFAWPDDAVEVGRIVDAWGIKGGLKVLPYAADPQALFSTKRWYLRPPEARPGPPALLCVTTAREHGDAIVATAEDVPDRNAAEALAGFRVFVPRGSFPTAAADEFYWVDLIGLEVVNRSGEALGRVADLIDNGAHSVLRVLGEGEPARERLIPFVSAHVDAVDLAGRRIVVDWGLDY